VNNSTDPARPGNAFVRFVGCCQGMTERDRRNARTTNYWMFGWMVVFVGSTFAMRGGYLEPGLLAWVLLAACTALGLVVVHFYMRFLRDADELLRKIQLEALAIGFGAAFVGTFTMSLIERLYGWSFDIGDLLLVMVIFYMLGIINGMRRYA
jgi:hypothetical protein